MDQSRNSIRIERNRVLLVEGAEDAKFLSALVQPPEGIQILPMGGKHGLKVVLDVIRAALKGGRGPRAIGVVRDADESAPSAFQSVCDALKSREFKPPKRHGEYSEGEPPAVGVFITLDGSSPGSLESLCVNSVCQEPEARCTEEYLHCVEKVGGGEWNNARRAKAFAYAYQAVSTDPEESLNVACAQGAWDRDSPAFESLRDFVQKLATVGGSADAAAL